MTYSVAGASFTISTDTVMFTLLSSTVNVSGARGPFVMHADLGIYARSLSTKPRVLGDIQRMSDNSIEVILPLGLSSRNFEVWLLEEDGQLAKDQVPKGNQRCQLCHDRWARDDWIQGLWTIYMIRKYQGKGHHARRLLDLRHCFWAKHITHTYRFTILTPYGSQYPIYKTTVFKTKIIIL